MTTTISVINQKGGVGKTTTVINLAASLSIMGQTNLVVDLDPQGNATTGFGKSNSDEDKNIYNLLIKKNNLGQAIQKTNIQNLDIIGSHVNLSGLEVETANDSKRAFVLKEILSSEKSGLLKKYDNIFIDCPPSLSLLTIMSLVASDELLVPLQTEFFALEGITQLVKTIDRIIDVFPTSQQQQIRVQLASMGSPIKGDLKYGAKRSNKDGSINLHAREITFNHPTKQERIIIIAPLPKANIWELIN